ncbi:MAG: LytR C-terminal domain-containing protein [Patescibacteria group bacterium]|nr:LytR C-terminal domain-containing protein [Patescibacteria group bacterium]
MDEMTRNARTQQGMQGNQVPVGQPQSQNMRGGMPNNRYRTGTQPQQNVRASGAGQKNSQAQPPQQKKTKNKMTPMRSEKTVSILDKIVAVCIFMLFFGLPLFFLNMTYQGISFEKQYYFYFWVFIGVIAWATRGILGGKIEIRRTSLDIPLGIFWIVYLLATIFSVDKYHSFFGFFGNPVNGLMSITALILAYYLIVSYVSKKRVMMLWWAVVTSGSIVVVWSFLTTMRFVPQEILQYISPSLTGSFTSLAAFLSMMLPMFIISLSLLDTKEGKSIKAKILTGVLFIITILNTIALSVLFGYVRWYVVLAAIALILVFSISGYIKVAQKTSAISIVVFLLLVGFLIYGQPLFTRTAIQPEASLKMGLSLEVAKNAIKSKPILGSGPGTYGYDFSLHRPKELNMSGQYDIRFYSDRGVLLESVSTTGILGVIALFIIFLTYISTVVHAFARSEDDQSKVVSLGLFLTSLMAMICGMFWAVDGMIILYGVLLAAMSIGILRESLPEGGDNKLVLSMSSTPQNALSFAFLAILVAVGVIFGFVTLGKMFVADVHAGNALKARVQSNFEQSSEKFMQAVNLNGQEGRYFTIISQYALDLANMELAKGDENANSEKVASFVNSATGAATAGRDLMPNDVLANETAGFIYENSGGYVNGALTQAVASYERARELEPQNPYLDIAVGKLKLMEAQTKGEDATEEKTALINEAKTLFESAKEKTTFDYGEQEMSVFAPAYYYIAITEEALGNTDAAIEAMTTALQVAQYDGSLSGQQLLSRQINYGFNLARLLQVRGTDEDNKNAEELLLQIIGVNDQEINSHLNLGLLYERTGRRDEAVAEYKKILAMLPEEDEKARENIQGLIDTVEQGGSNVDVNNQGEVSDGMDTAEKESDVVEDEGDVEEAEKVSVLVIGGNNSEAEAAQGQQLLEQEGYAVTEPRNEDVEHKGVVVMYSGDADRDEVRNIEKTLRAQFSNVTSERDDEETATYNHDIVVVVGSDEVIEESEEETAPPEEE